MAKRKPTKSTKIKTRGKEVTGTLEDYKDKVILISGFFIFFMLLVGFISTSELLLSFSAIVMVLLTVYGLIYGIKLYKIKYKLAPFIITLFAIYLLMFLISLVLSMIII